MVRLRPLREPTLLRRFAQGTGFTPVKVELTEAGRRAFCMCKHTGGQPFCDGSHAKLKPA